MYAHANNHPLTDDRLIELVSSFTHHKLLPIEAERASEQSANVSVWSLSTREARNEFVSIHVAKKRKKHAHEQTTAPRHEQTTAIAASTFAECVGMLIEGHVPIDMRSYRQKLNSLASEDMLRTITKHHRKLRSMLQSALEANDARLPDHDDLLALTALLTRRRLAVVDKNGRTRQEYAPAFDVGRGCALLRSAPHGILCECYADMDALRASDDARNTILRENHKALRMAELRSYYERVTGSPAVGATKRAELVAAIDAIVKKN
jgi:hypothetical protein